MNTFAQNLLSEQIQFYPLQVGNKWIFKHVYFDNGINTIWYSTDEIIKDTIMPNGKRYYVFKLDSGVKYSFERIDSLSLKISEYTPSGEKVKFDLSIVDSLGWSDGNGRYFDIWTSINQLPVGYLNVKGIRTEYQSRSYFSYPSVFLSKGFGCSGYEGGRVGSYSSGIIGAIINGIGYGTLTSINEEIELKKFNLLQNYPNPINSQTTIKFTIPTPHNPPLSKGGNRGVHL